MATVFIFLQSPEDKAELPLANILEVLFLVCKLDIYFLDNMLSNTKYIKELSLHSAYKH